MRIILEGGSGVGKTTLARALGTVTGVPVYRPFRGKDEHINPQTVAAMQDLGLSVNGWEEDMYTADFLSVVSASVIVDRSMPSAMAFNAVSSCALDARSRRTILRLWGERIVAARATLVLVVCSEALRAERSPARGGIWETKGIADAILEACQIVPGLPVWRVDTGKMTTDALAQVITRRVILGAPSSFVETLNGSNPGAWFAE